MSVFVTNPITADKIPSLIKITQSRNRWLVPFRIIATILLDPGKAFAAAPRAPEGSLGLIGSY